MPSRWKRHTAIETEYHSIFVVTKNWPFIARKGSKLMPVIFFLLKRHKYDAFFSKERFFSLSLLLHLRTLELAEQGAFICLDHGHNKAFTLLLILWNKVDSNDKAIPSISYVSTHIESPNLSSSPMGSYYCSHLKIFTECRHLTSVTPWANGRAYF